MQLLTSVHHLTSHQKGQQKSNNARHNTLQFVAIRIRKTNSNKIEKI